MVDMAVEIVALSRRGALFRVTASFSHPHSNGIPLSMVLARISEMGAEPLAVSPLGDSGAVREFQIEIDSHAEAPTLVLLEVRTHAGDLLTSSLWFAEQSGEEATYEMGARATQAAETAHRRQESIQHQVIGEPAPGRPVWAITLFAENLLLSERLWANGTVIAGVTECSLSAAIARILADVASQWGFQDLEKIAGFEPAAAQQWPVIAALARSVHADTAADAVALAQARLRPQLDLLALRRGATPRVRGGVVARHEADGTLRVESTWLDRGYGGNLLTGFLAGEDERGFYQAAQSLQVRPGAQLWLALFADAQAETRPDFQFFRYFSLLEAAGKDRFGGKKVTLDDGKVAYQPAARAGAKLKPYTGKEARGAVYMITRDLLGQANASPESYSATALGSRATLWEETELWTLLRNRVAHRGHWQLAPGEQPDSKTRRMYAMLKDRGHDGTAQAGMIAVQFCIAAACRDYVGSLIRPSAGGDECVNDTP